MMVLMSTTWNQQTNMNKPKVLCGNCDKAYSIHSKFITIHEKTELSAQIGYLLRFTCSKCKQEATSLVLSEDDIKSGDSPMLRKIKDSNGHRESKQEKDRIVNENVLNKEKKNK